MDNNLIPKHIALIPDGNRRWAKKRGFHPWKGHQVGSQTLEKILEKVQELKIPYFTFWASSWDNLTKRSKTEVNFLFKLYAESFKKMINDKRIHQNKVKINVIGKWREILPLRIQKIIDRVIKITKNYENYFLTFLLAYDGRDEMIDCIQKIINFHRLHSSVKITPGLIKENLWTKDLPEVDLIIRTGCDGDPHNSAGFMMWDTNYSQFYFTPTLFPAFKPEEFEKIIKNYSKRKRRLGA